MRNLNTQPAILAFTDWAIQLSGQPDRQKALGDLAYRDAVAFWQQAMGQPVELIVPAPDDHRFTHPSWRTNPFALAQQSFLRAERWWRDATTSVPGVSAQHERMVSFITRQMLDAVSPSNSPLLNPEVLEASRSSNGDNLRHGFSNFLQDLTLLTQKALPLAHVPGVDVAITPGQVVFRNGLIELLQYTPTTATVRPEPILIVPAWIMKYYILDLSPGESLIRYLVSEGFTVFCISWLNPGAAQHDLGLDDYRIQGVTAARDAIAAICGAPKIHALGYCLGGTLLAIAAAAMARDGDKSLASVGLLAAQTDFTEPGELQVFMDEGQLAELDELMAKQGYLDGSQMAAAFAMLRATDMIWSRSTRRYYLGEQEQVSDMMSWDADTTRMPARMHSEYLHKLYLHNDLAEGRLIVEDRPVAISDIKVPCFLVSAETDWVAPWKSVYKFLLLNGADVTFALASGGHNGGIVSVPGMPHRHYRLLRRPTGATFEAAQPWMDATPPIAGSWWTEYVAFLGTQSSPAAAPPPMGNAAVRLGPFELAPGSYVMQR